MKENKKKFTNSTMTPAEWAIYKTIKKAHPDYSTQRAITVARYAYAAKMKNKNVCYETK